MWGEYIRISIPVLISDGILALGNSSVAMVVGRLGKSFVAANAVTAVTQQLSSVLIQGVSQAGAIITGAYAGRRRQRESAGTGLCFAGAWFSLWTCLLCDHYDHQRSCHTCLSSFGRDVKTGRGAYGSNQYYRVLSGTNSIMSKGTIRGGGDTKVLMVADNICLWLFSLPLGILAGFVLHLPAFWIYICLKIDQIMKCIWCFFRLRSGKWIKKIKSYS